MGNPIRFGRFVSRGIRRGGRAVQVATDTTADLWDLTLDAASLIGRMIGKLHLFNQKNKGIRHHTAAQSSNSQRSQTNRSQLTGVPLPDSLVKLQEFQYPEQTLEPKFNDYNQSFFNGPGPTHYLRESAQPSPYEPTATAPQESHHQTIADDFDTPGSEYPALGETIHLMRHFRTPMKPLQNIMRDCRK